MQLTWTQYESNLWFAMADSSFPLAFAEMYESRWQFDSANSSFILQMAILMNK